MGFGRFYTLRDVGFVFIACAQASDYPADFATLTKEKLAELYGGVSPVGQTYPGYNEYGRGLQKEVQGTIQSNFPPLYYNVNDLKVNPGTKMDEPSLAAILEKYEDYPTWITQLMAPAAKRDDPFSFGEAVILRFAPTRTQGGVDVPYKTSMPVPPDDPIDPRKSYNHPQYDQKSLLDLFKDAQKTDSELVSLGRTTEMRANDRQRVEEIKKFLRPAFDPNNWNFNLLFNLSSFPELDNNGDAYPINYWWEAKSAAERKGLLNGSERLQWGDRMVQGCMLFELICPSVGWVPINPDIALEIDFLEDIRFKSKSGEGRLLSDFDLSGNKLSSSEKDKRKMWYSSNISSAWGTAAYGGTLPSNFFYRDRPTPLNTGFSGKTSKYSWVTKPFTLQNGKKIESNKVDVSVKIFAHGSKNTSSMPQSVENIDLLVQQIDFEFPSIDAPAPVLINGVRGHVDELGATTDPVAPQSLWALTHDTNPYFRIGVEPGQDGKPRRAWWNSGTLHNNNQLRKGGRFAQAQSRDGGLIRDEDPNNGRPDPRGDTVRSIVIGHGDTRIVAATPLITKAMNYFVPHALYNTSDQYFAHDFFHSTSGDRLDGASGSSADMALVKNINYNGRTPSGPLGDPNQFKRDLVQQYGDFDNGMGLVVDGAYINKPDEGNTHSLFFNANDPNHSWSLRFDLGNYPYFARDWIHEAGSPSYFSPNRITSGPGMFGSLPTGVASNRPWETLLFRPNSFGYSGIKSHPGAMAPHDHYLMDLFWMPVVEPYAISEPLSTAGKVNLNYQILPFRHVKRDSSMRGIFRSEVMVCVPTPGNSTNSRSTYTVHYKHNSGRGNAGLGQDTYHWRDKPSGGAIAKRRLRTVILEHETLKQFQRKFDNYEMFKSASEICQIHLVPQQYADRIGATSPNVQINTYTPTVSNDGRVPDMESGKYWSEHAVVGDNSRERSYGNIYSRVTTQSNVFKVHYRAEVIKQGRRQSGGSYSTFDPELDSVVSAYRGSTNVERYLDPNDPRIPNYAGGGNPAPIGEFYRFRIFSPTRFAP
jgi:uncharacterized protein (TIGR02600 family)